MSAQFSATTTTQSALRVLGGLIRAGRLSRKWSETDLANRVGVSRETIRRVEAGDTGVRIGAVFDSAVITGVPLFAESSDQLNATAAQIGAGLALLPRRARRPKEFDNDF